MNFAKTPVLRALTRLSTPARRLPSAITISSRAFSSAPMVFQQVQRPESTFEHVTFEALTKEDAAVSHLQNSAYTRPASDDRIANAKAAMEAKGFVVHVVNNKDEAFHKILDLIPEGASVNTAHSTTLEEISFMDYLISGKHKWNNVKGVIMAEKDPKKQGELRRSLGNSPDVFLTSMCAIGETDGSLTHADQTGTKTGPVTYGAERVVVVAGSNKIVKDEHEAYKRTMEHCLPVVSAYGRKIFKMPSSTATHYEVLRHASPMSPGRVHVVLVKEALGY
ncbi:hypothetical protein BGZ82_006352 [Podila clonocystis]|nr:hypothetical protein BGZ82_006352 [Podila clonocystis]